MGSRKYDASPIRPLPRLGFGFTFSQLLVAQRTRRCIDSRASRSELQCNTSPNATGCAGHQGNFPLQRWGRQGHV